MVNYFGCDIESPMGIMKVIATNEEAREVDTFQDVLNFLSQHKFRGAKFFHFNLTFDAEHILKLTNDIEFLKRLYFEGAAPKGIDYFPLGSRGSEAQRLSWKGVKLTSQQANELNKSKVGIRYIPTKFLRICFGKEKHRSCVSCLDISQFYGGWGLDKVARKYLGEYKNPISGKRLGSEEGYYEKNKEETKEYCRKDAELTLKVAMMMKKTIESAEMKKGSLSFRNPISQAKVSEMYIHDNFRYPKIPDKLEFWHWLSEQAYHGGIFSTLKRGMFNKPLYSYDINSAYPFQMDMLPHWANGKFHTVVKPDEFDTRYGWFLCRFDCPYISYPDYSKPYTVEFCYEDVTPDHCEEVLMNPKRVVYPTGNRRQWVTKIEYEWMVTHGYEPIFENGFVWVQEKEEYESPFAWIKDVYYTRRKIKDADSEDIQQWALKIAMNGAYGKTAQKKKGRGALTNFFYASYITAGTRLQISTVMLQKPEAIVEVATDSLLSLEPLSVNVSGTLGDWSPFEYEKGLVIGSGIRQQWNKDGSFATHARGLTYKSDWDMMKEIKEGFNKKEKRPNIDCDYLYFTKERPIHLGEVIFHHKILSLKDLGVFTDVSKKLNVNTDVKRNWVRRYRDFRDLLESEPMSSKPLSVAQIENTKF